MGEVTGGLVWHAEWIVARGGEVTGTVGEAREGEREGGTEDVVVTGGAMCGYE